MNELLLWMSARTEGGLASFRTKVAELGRGTRFGSAHHRIAEWNLSLLGHAEFGTAARGGWRIAPPLLAAGDLCGPYDAVLCGARTPQLIDRLQEAARGRLSVHSQADAPDLVAVAAENAAELLSITSIAGLRLQWNAPLAILWACVPPREQALDPAAMPAGGWLVSRFSKSRLEWTPTALADARATPNGLFRFQSDRGSAYIVKEAGAVLATEAAAGKYRVLTRRNRVLAYDARSAEFSVPLACRPPPLVERALVVSSGKLPALRGGRIYYRQVRREIAEAAASLLGQRLN